MINATINLFNGNRKPKKPDSTKKVEGSIKTCPEIRAIITPVLTPKSFSVANIG